MPVGLVEQVSVDLGAFPYIATDRTQSLHDWSSSRVARSLAAALWPSGRPLAAYERCSDSSLPATKSRRPELIQLLAKRQRPPERSNYLGSGPDIGTLRFGERSSSRRRGW